MPRADLILALIKAGRNGNQDLITKTVEAMAAEERAMRHTVLANRLLDQLKVANSPTRPALPLRQSEDHGGLLEEITPQKGFDSLLLPPSVYETCRDVVEEQQRRDLLRSYGLEPRSKLLFVGPPGNGKTSLAEALALELMCPLFVVRYDAVIGSFLGETSSRLKKLFDFVRSHACVLFFDEFDTVGKERGDSQETGEIKRVVSSLLLQMDALPSHVVVVTATNHPELLDRAVWRRFQVKVDLPSPTTTQMISWLESFADEIGGTLGVAPRTIANKLKFSSYAELQEFCDDIRRRSVLALPDCSLASITKNTIKLWEQRIAKP